MESDDLKRQELIDRLRRISALSERDIVIREVIPPDFGIKEWGMQILQKGFQNKVVSFESILVLKGEGEIKIHIGNSFYLIAVYKDYMELFETTSDWMWIRRLRVFNRAMHSRVELNIMIEPDICIEIIGKGVEFVPDMLMAERLGMYIDERGMPRKETTKK